MIRQVRIDFCFLRFYVQAFSFFLYIWIPNVLPNNFLPFQDTSGPENVTSGSDGEADSDADNVFLPSRANNPNADNNDKDFISSEKTKAIPKTLNLGR